MNLGDVVEWTVETTTNGSDHPWHMHGFSFQPVKMELNTANGYVELYSWDFTEYVDSIYVPGKHRLTLCNAQDGLGGRKLAIADRVIFNGQEARGEVKFELRCATYRTEEPGEKK